ncbi:AAA family ATPase [Caulobacter sp. DWR1-3-2b1]|uniref:AAA family ATPase n=1 Tax=Caulobacter sp. DWR1-3-2b1 TaxID=2804670 RepID=UPI003CF702DF
MILVPPRRIIVTGGPGSGKTSLIDALEVRGFARSFEAGRTIIQEEVRAGGTALPWGDPQAYADRMLSRELTSYRMADGLTGPVFFDRGLPDIIGYLTLCELPVPDAVDDAVRRLRYDPVVFIAPPWPEIFAQDAERRQDLAEAERTHAAMAQVYPALGYRLVELPRVDVETRADFVLERLAATS